MSYTLEFKETADKRVILRYVSLNALLLSLKNYTTLENYETVFVHIPCINTENFAEGSYRFMDNCNKLYLWAGLRKPDQKHYIDTPDIKNKLFPSTKTESFEDYLIILTDNTAIKCASDKLKEEVFKLGEKYSRNDKFGNIDKIISLSNLSIYNFDEKQLKFTSKDLHLDIDLSRFVDKYELVAYHIQDINNLFLETKISSVITKIKDNEKIIENSLKKLLNSFSEFVKLNIIEKKLNVSKMIIMKNDKIISKFNSWGLYYKYTVDSECYDDRITLKNLDEGYIMCCEKINKYIETTNEFIAKDPANINEIYQNKLKSLYEINNTDKIAQILLKLNELYL